MATHVDSIEMEQYRETCESSDSNSNIFDSNEDSDSSCSETVGKRPSDESGGDDDGAGDGNTITDPHIDEMAFRSITRTMLAMQKSMRSMDLDMKKTNQSMRGVTTRLKTQGQFVQKLHKSMNMLEKKASLLLPPNSSVHSTGSVPAPPFRKFSCFLPNSLSRIDSSPNTMNGTPRSYPPGEYKRLEVSRASSFWGNCYPQDRSSNHLRTSVPRSVSYTGGIYPQSRASSPCPVTAGGAITSSRTLYPAACSPVHAESPVSPLLQLQTPDTGLSPMIPHQTRGCFRPTFRGFPLLTSFNLPLPVMNPCPVTKCQIPPCSSNHATKRLTKLAKKLPIAAEKGRTRKVLRLLKAGVDVNYTTADGWTALHRAAAQGHSRVVALLLKFGADVNVRTSYGFSPLHMSAFNDHTGRCVMLLIKAGAYLDVWNRSGRTPLHHAAENGNVAAVRALVAAGANKHAKNNDGRTPFDIALSAHVRRHLVGHYPDQKFLTSRIPLHFNWTNTYTRLRH